MRKWVYLTLAIAFSGLIVFTSTVTGAKNNEAGGYISQWINSVFFGGRLSDLERGNLVGVAAKLFGHFSLFMLSGLFLELSLASFPKLGKASFVIFLIYSLCLSSAGEIIQIFSSGRSPQLTDVILDLCGFWFIPLIKYRLKKE
ncbi:MAG: VanZ family protein [Bacilli bacterium]|nr:VanZ family protein [Bacilli bacterium]